MENADHYSTADTWVQNVCTFSVAVPLSRCRVETKQALHFHRSAILLGTPVYLLIHVNRPYPCRKSSAVWFWGVPMIAPGSCSWLTGAEPIVVIFCCSPSGLIQFNLPKHEFKKKSKNEIL